MRLFSSLMALLAVAAPISLLAQAGVLDNTFGNGSGYVATHYDNSYSLLATALVIQPDGKIVAGGTGGGTDFALIRYQADGTLDSAFHMNNGGDNLPGIVQTGFGDYPSGVQALALQADGKIVAAGYARHANSLPSMVDYDLALTRYHSNGRIDSTFGTNGIVTTDFGGPLAGSDDYAFALAIQPDGKIVVAGDYNNSQDYGVLVARYTSAGVLDNTFDTDGFMTYSPSVYQEEGLGLALQPDGKILVTGYTTYADTRAKDLMLIRLNANGSFDTSFGTSGVAIQGQVGPMGPMGDQFGRAIAVLADGSIVVGGETTFNTDFDMLVMKFSSTGSLVTAFGENGMRPISFGPGTDHGYAMKVQSDGKILMAGTAGQFTPDKGESFGFGLARLNSDGNYDMTFGPNSNSLSRETFGQFDNRAYALALQPDGKIVAAGVSCVNIGFDCEEHFLVARYNSGTTGVEQSFPEALEGNSVRVYPNPATNLLTVETPAPGYVTLRDLTGKILMTANHSGAITLDISGLPAGLYLLQTAGNGAKMFVKE